MNDVFCEIKKYLATDFESQLFDAACELLSTNNKLRFNSFACAIRELSRHILKRLAPDDNVRSCVWFKICDKNKPDMITRHQRMKYAFQNVLSDKYAETVFESNLLEKISSQLIDTIDELSEFTHVNPETFGIDDAIVKIESGKVFKTLLDFFQNIEKGKQEIDEALNTDEIREDIESTFNQCINEIDCLSTHHEILHVTVWDTAKLYYGSSDSIRYAVKGIVRVRLQYGSDGDQRRGNGYKMTMDFPFQAECSRFLVRSKIRTKYFEETLKVDTSSFYGEDDIEEQIEECIKEIHANT